MDYSTAYHFLFQQGTATDSAADTLLVRLQQQKPPIPGQVTSLLLALKVVQEGLKGVASLDRNFVYALYRLARESQFMFKQGQKAGIQWPPLLEKDLQRIEVAVENIFADRP